MLTDTSRWSHARGNEVVPSRWQATVQVLDAYRFTDALMDTITDPQIKALPRVGAIDQYVDSTDMTDREAAEVRRQYINGPAKDIDR